MKNEDKVIYFWIDMISWLFFVNKLFVEQCFYCGEFPQNQNWYIIMPNYSFYKVQVLRIILCPLFELNALRSQIFIRIKLFEVPTTQIVHNCYNFWIRVLSCVLDCCCQVKGRWSTHKYSLVFNHVVGHVQGLLVLYLVGFID